ncbi:probable polygalacturonase [Ricinus communis]|uniref:probable polygalacturonase n=1 Tax=Ricinus communis TaxID=3988 RepID=UPI00201A78F7|nr:probable polygalacturonase [Ricinus communis]
MLAFLESGRYHYLEIFTALVFVGSISVGIAESRNVQIFNKDSYNAVNYAAINCRKHTAFLTDFGGVGDGKTLNTKAFQAAIANLSQYADDGGAELIVPAGKWLTGSFNLTSHFTLFLHRGATILASQNEADFPIIAALPSFGVEKDFPDGRFSSLIRGINLTDVVITGNNGTIDGQGAPWWDKFEKGLFKASRPLLIDIMYTDQLQISNITLVNSPSWHVHPVYCSNVLVQGVTIIAPVEVPNTDGINPNSCTNTRIEDCYIVSGDDCIAIKSGWDQYGIKFGMPTKDVVVRRLTCISPQSAGIALGSEMSGGIENVRVEDITAFTSQSAVRIKTAPGRGGYVKDIFVRRMTLQTMKYVFWISGNYKTHPDDGFDPNALAEIKNINYRDIVARNVNMSGAFDGFPTNHFTGICMSNVTIQLSQTPKKPQWNCSNVEGVSSHVTPTPCSLFPEKPVDCTFPEDKLPIESIHLKTCTAKRVFPGV